MPSDAPSPTGPHHGDGDNDAGADAADAPAAVAADTDADPPAVEWREGSHPRLRWFARYVGAGLFGGMFLLVVVGVALVAASSLLSGGGTDALLLFVVLALVGGPFSLLYLAAATGVNGRERLLELVPRVRGLRPRWVALASLLGFGAILLVAVWPPLFYFSIAAVACLSVVGAAANAAGTVDPAAGTLERRYGDHRREGDVRGLRSVRTHCVGSLAVLRLGYEGRDRLSLVKPRVVVVPRDAADAVCDGLAAVRDAEWPEYDRYRASLAERVAIAAFGVLFVGVGAAVGAVVAAESDGFAAYTGGVFVVLGCVFLLYAWVG